MQLAENQKQNLFLQGIAGTKYYGKVGTSEFKKNITEDIKNKEILYIQPEGQITNGKGILQFKPLAFELFNTVQPVIIEIDRPFLDINVSSIDTSPWIDLFFFLFSPLTLYNVKFLEPIQKNGDVESVFREKVRSSIATALDVRKKLITINLYSLISHNLTFYLIA